jgi:hypothetical protein
MNRTDSMMGHWVSGFAAGEATFCLALRPRKNSSLFKVICRFAIGLLDDDRHILKEIQQYLGCGTIVAVGRTPKQQTGTKPQARFVIDSIKDLSDLVVPHFDRYPLRAKKAEDYQIFREGVLFAREVGRRARTGGVGRQGRGTRWKADDLERFQRYAQRIVAVRKYAA